MTEANKLFQEMAIILPEGEVRADQLDWNPHPAFPGVWMKHLILGKDTGGHLSCHLVRIEQGNQIGSHVHEASLEVHEVLSGHGICRMVGRESAYSPGVCLIIPAGILHCVEAFGEDMHLVARFAPALM